MKATGIIRKIGLLGRLTLPSELRHELSIDFNDPVEIFVDEEYIKLKRYSPECFLCRSIEDTKYFKGKNICQNCINEL